jgi:D-xylose transport system ATP-binding protein
VLRDGAVEGTLEAAGTNADEVIRRMVGRRIEDYYPRRQSEPGRALLSLRDLGVAPPPGSTLRLREVSLEVRAGEVLGIGGLMGAGRTELLNHLVGLWGTRLAGTVELDGQPLAARGPREALRRGLALVTEDRKRYGLVLQQGVSFNVTLSSLRSLRRGPFIDRDGEVVRTKATVDDLRIRVQTLEQALNTLSGGNQQKVVLGKVMLTQPRVLLLDEPTRGIDVGARLEVYELINRLTAAGKAIVLVSSELGELMGMSDRIVMLCEGRIGGVFERGAATQEQLLAAAMGRLERAA